MVQLPHSYGGVLERLGCAVLGLIGALSYSRLPRAEVKETANQATPLGPSRRTVYKLAALFSLDAFAGGFTVQSLMALWLFERFDLSLAAASAFFFWSNVLAAFSYPVAARLGTRFGLVNTMVFTHIPSSVCLILAAFSPNLTIVLVLLLVRSALSQMDVPTRTSYVMAVVTPAERTAAASVTAVPRSLASAISPAIGRAPLDRVCGLAARDLRRLEDRLRPIVAVFVSSHQAAGGEGRNRVSFQTAGGVEARIDARDEWFHEHGKRYRRRLLFPLGRQAARRPENHARGGRPADRQAHGL